MQSRFRQRRYKLNTIKEVNENNINYSLSNIQLNNNVKVKRIKARNSVTAKKVKPRPRTKTEKILEQNVSTLELNKSKSRPVPRTVKRFRSSLTGKLLTIPPKKSLQTINNPSLPIFSKSLPPRPTHKPQHNYLNKNELKGIQMNSPMNNYDKWDIVKIKVKGKPIYGKIIFIQQDKMNNIIEVECSPEFSNYMISKIGLKSIYEKTYDISSKIKKRYVGIKEIRDNIMPSYKAAEQDRIKLLEKLLSSKMPIDPKLLPIIHNPNEFKKMYTMANLGTEF
jgi:hypothetical protein